MNMIHVFLIKETLEEATVLKEILESHSCKVIDIATSYQEAIIAYKKLSVDIIITDMFLNGKPEGIAFIENISLSKKQVCPFIYLTGFENRDFYQRAKLTRPFAMLHKPFNEIEILYTLENIFTKTQQQIVDVSSEYQTKKKNIKSLFIKKKNALHSVPFKSILFIEVENRYCNIITEKEKFVVLISLGKIKEFLHSYTFLQVHRKYIVNTLAITQIIPKDNLIILKGDYKITLGVKYKTILKDLVILR
ncbi:LytTR family DNA-binding domain-containing protein [uncultured Kordia sp.]|uniref:LytR/AlgR family response regulator transcription factor n=1 Tax=uncultured Kordia sp. TaxID=507699 RepID=UPI002635B1A6|nr:response regulator transcription factor [uncultured Kordia sp.]